VLFSVADTTHSHLAVASLVFAQLASESTPFAVLHRHLQDEGALTSIEHESPITLYPFQLTSLRDEFKQILHLLFGIIVFPIFGKLQPKLL
jgi:hypothetical protein